MIRCSWERSAKNQKKRIRGAPKENILSVRRRLAILAERERRIQQRYAVLESQYSNLLRLVRILSKKSYFSATDLENRFVCSACGKRGADIKPDFHWDTPGRSGGAIRT